MTPEGKLMRIAASQHRVFTRQQALAAGMTVAEIRSRRERGLWVRLHREVYTFADVKMGWEQRVVAATLSCGPGAVASHASAGMVWGFIEKLDVPHVTVPGTRHVRRKGSIVHSTDRVVAVTRNGYRVTTPVQTVIDLAGVISEAALEEVVDLAHAKRLVPIRRLVAALDEPRNRNRPGTRALREIVAARDPDRAIQSHLETKLFRALRLLGLPLPVPQFEVETRGGKRFVDYAYPEQMLAIEMDGFETRASPQALDRERARQNELEELDFRFRRFTWNAVKVDVSDVCYTIGRALGLVPTRWRSRSDVGV